MKMAQAKQRGEYPPDWNDIAMRVKNDVGWRCVRCGHVHEPSTGYTLTVHHFNGYKNECSRWNLMALCQRCHLSVQARVNPENPLMFDPASWCMPYIAGFYESGLGVPGPLYDLRAWRARYERETGKAWPVWAPQTKESQDAQD